MHRPWLLLFVSATMATAQPGPADAQTKFPPDLVGNWCSINYDGERVDISTSSLEEGDGLCQLRGGKTDTWVDNKIFELTMSCDLGVEGKRRQVRTELFTVFRIENLPHMLRAGGMYNPKNLSLYKRCK